MNLKNLTFLIILSFFSSLVFSGESTDTIGKVQICKALEGKLTPEELKDLVTSTTTGSAEISFNDKGSLNRKK